MDCNPFDIRCKCKKCNHDEHHENRRVHDLITRLATVVPNQIVEGLAGAVVSHFASLSLTEVRDLEDFVDISLRCISSIYKVQLARVDALISSAKSKSKQFAQNAISAHILEQIAYKWWVAVDESQRIDLLMNGHPYSVRIPSGHGAWSLQEVLFANTYNHKLHNVDSIYDLGAFIGISALLLNSIYPEAHLTCVEPSAANLTFLTDNLKSNLTNFDILPAAVFNGQKEIRMTVNVRPSMLNSVRWEKAEDAQSVIPAVYLADLIKSESFGIKVDIEGAEFLLESSVDTLRSATWIIGELHFDELITLKDMWLINMLQKDFFLQLSLPRFVEIEGRYIVAQEFLASNKRNILDHDVSLQTRK